MITSHLDPLKKGKMANGRVLRWSLALQPYQFRVEAIKGKDNVGADYLSRMDLDVNLRVIYELVFLLEYRKVIDGIIFCVSV